ncbi:MAG: alpha/beta hydrolase [Gammaproteobacteria bacterium]|nr:alpha/beta hydrolase [Gammaproteobacteria bacterium]
MLKIILSVTIIAIVVVIGFFYFMQRRFLYFPQSGNLEPAKWGMTHVKLIQLKTADKLLLGAWYHPARERQFPTIVYFHGNAGHIGYWGTAINPYIRAGYGLLLLEYRGYGTNPGSPTEKGLYLDARAAMDFLKSEGVAPRHIVLFGESLGTGIALQMASEFAVGAVILQSPYTSIVDVARIHYPFLPVHWLLKDRYDSMNKIETLKAPLFIIHGEQDEIIPVKLAQQLYAAAPQPKTLKIYPNAGHNTLPDLSADVIQFLSATFPPQ